MRNDNLLTPKEAAEYLGVHLNTIYRMLKTGEISGFRLGPRLLRIPKDQLIKGQGK